MLSSWPTQPIGGVENDEGALRSGFRNEKRPGSELPRRRPGVAHAGGVGMSYIDQLRLSTVTRRRNEPRVCVHRRVQPILRPPQQRLEEILLLDLVLLSRSILRPDQSLRGVHYFTARLRDDGKNSDDLRRQNTYLDALSTLPLLTAHMGHFLVKMKRCSRCAARWVTYEEKMSDVNLAVQLILDAFDDAFDTAIVVSADSDLSTPIRQVKHRFPTKRVVVAFPPNRSSAELKSVADAAFVIGRKKLKDSQLPDEVSTSTGHTLRRPSTWV